MKKNFQKIIIALCISFVSCSSHSTKEIREEGTSVIPSSTVKEVFETGRVLPKIQCKSNPAFSFALYLPSNYDTTKKFPSIIFFDPHAGGEFVVKKYQHLAEEFGFILIGSNDSKNGMSLEKTSQIANTLISEAILRFSIFNDASLAGFSGGAKVALSAAEQNQKVSSVIYCGAVTPVSAGSKFSLLGFAGINDMNYSDVVAFDQSLQNSSLNHFLIDWNGKHEWPDSSVFRDAFYWIAFDKMRNSQIKPDPALMQKFLNENAGEIVNAKSDWQRVQLFRKESFFLRNIVDVTSFGKKSASLASKPSYQKELESRTTIQREEQEKKQEYIQEFQTKDIPWWRQEIARLQSQKDPMHLRLLGFLSLAGYSISSNAIQQNNFPVAEKMLAIYQLADPKNSDQPFLEACFYAKQGKNELAIQSLQRAVDLGLNDASKIINEPMLSSLQNTPEVQKLLTKMNKQ